MCGTEKEATFRNLTQVDGAIIIFSIASRLARAFSTPPQTSAAVGTESCTPSTGAILRKRSTS